ncbi:MAG TPA: hypothetical protein VK601_25880, partial [Kofleriaceae bacterium]|nr:hypothetical protein [Kofleriaceae bacterium]
MLPRVALTSILASVLAALGCHGAAPPRATSYAAATATSVALPGAAAYGVAMDYIVFDPRTRTVWAPAG